MKPRPFRLPAIAACMAIEPLAAVNATNVEDETYITTCLQRGDCF